jgi:hypothetical protein
MTIATLGFTPSVATAGVVATAGAVATGSAAGAAAAAGTAVAAGFVSFFSSDFFLPAPSSNFAACFLDGKHMLQKGCGREAVG